MALLSATRDLPQMPFLLPNLDLDDHRRPPNTLMIYCSEKLRKNHHLSVSEPKEMHPDHLGNVSVRCVQHSLQKDLKIPTSFPYRNIYNYMHRKSDKKHNTHHIHYTNTLHITTHNGLRNPQPSTTPDTPQTSLQTPSLSLQQTCATYTQLLSLSTSLQETITKYCAHTHRKSAALKRTYPGTRVVP